MRRFSAFRRLAALAGALALFAAAPAYAQPASATWSLSSTTLTTAATTGTLTAPNEAIGPGPAPAMSVFNYTADGQRLNAGTSGWVAGPEDSTRFVQFDAVHTGAPFTVTHVSFEYGAAARNAAMASNVWYSTNGWVTRTKLNTTALSYSSTGMALFTRNPNVAVPSGSTFSVRIYPYALLSQSAMSPQFATHRRVRIAGNAAVPPNTACNYLCNTDFEDDVIVNPGLFAQVLQNSVSCWKTTAADGLIEFWGSGFQNITAFTGNQFAELNANATATLYQTFTAVAGNVVTISFAHRGRYALPDSMSVSIGSGTSFTTLGTFGDDRTAWGYYTVTHVLTASGPTEIRFNSIHSGGNDPAGGNFLDAISITCPSGICGVKYEDVDGNGVRGSTEPGLPNWTIALAGASTATATTDANGAYCFMGLQPGAYSLSEVQKLGWHRTAPAAPGTHAVQLQAGPNPSQFLFGNQRDAAGVCVAPPAGLVGWWPGDTHTADLTVFNNNGTLVGGAAYGTGKVADAFRFTSAAQYVSVPDSPVLNFYKEDFSIDAWIQTSNRTERLTIVDKRSGTAANPVGYSLFLQGGRLAFELADGSASLVHVAPGPVLDNGAWHFVAVTVDRDSPTGGKLYVNGVLAHTFDPTSRGGAVTNPAAVRFGQRHLGADPSFDGKIDEVEIFDRVVPPAAIEAIFRAGNLGKCKPEPGQCDQKETALPINTGLDHTTGSPYTVGGADAFWSITLDADTSHTAPRPAEVVRQVAPIWAAAQGNSQWIAPSQVDLDTNPIGFEQDEIGLGLYRYALEICIVEKTATSLTFNLSLLSDNTSTVWLRLPNNTRLPVGASSGTGFGSPTSIVTTLTGSFAPGTYILEVDVTNDGISPDFTGLNMTGFVAGANLFLQKHECCNSSGKATGTKFNDFDGNGQQGDNEPGIGGVTIQILQGTTVVATTTTDSAGNYFFDVPPGTYTIREVVPVGYTQTFPSGGTHTVTIGPGGIAPNLDFGNQVIPCIGAGAVWKCKPTVGGRYLELMVTNNGTMPVSSISATALTPGVTLALFNTVPYPVAVGASVVMNFDVTGLAPGAAAQIVISMSGPPDMSGKSEECCRDTLTVVRPGGPGVILKWCGPVWTDFHLVDFVRDPRRPRMDRWTVRMRDALGRSTTAVTDTSGYALIEGMPLGTYTYSVDMQHGWRMLEPSTGFYQRTFREGDRGINGLRFVLSDVTVSGLDGSLPIPSEYALRENIPNPFTSTTNIRYALPQSGHVRLDVFDMLGRHVATLVDGVQAAGQYEEPFEARELASGVYLYVLKAGPFVASRRMLVIN